MDALVWTPPWLVSYRAPFQHTHERRAWLRAVYARLPHRTADLRMVPTYRVTTRASHIFLRMAPFAWNSLYVPATLDTRCRLSGFAMPATAVEGAYARASPVIAAVGSHRPGHGCRAGSGLVGCSLGWFFWFAHGSRILQFISLAPRAFGFLARFGFLSLRASGHAQRRWTHAATAYQRTPQVYALILPHVATPPRASYTRGFPPPSARLAALISRFVHATPRMAALPHLDMVGHITWLPFGSPLALVPFPLPLVPFTRWTRVSWLPLDLHTRGLPLVAPSPGVWVLCPSRSSTHLPSCPFAAPRALSATSVRWLARVWFRAVPLYRQNSLPGLVLAAPAFVPRLVSCPLLPHHTA